MQTVNTLIRCRIPRHLILVCTNFLFALDMLDFLVCITLYSFLFCNHLKRGRYSWLVAFIVFLVSYYCKYSVALPHGVMGWSAVCDCDISHTFFRYICYSG